MRNECEVMKLIEELRRDLELGRLVTDKTGVSLVERQAWQLDLDPTQPILQFGDVKKTNEEYVAKELAWYLSMDRSVYPMMADVKIWTQVCDKDGQVNSNYGWCIFSNDNFNQYDHVVAKLSESPLSRQTQMIYTRPQMWLDFNLNGRSDFMCTTSTMHLIRDGRLYYHVSQRSADLVYGFFNDLAWHHYVYTRMYQDLKKVYPDLEHGRMYYHCNSIHVYERHFDLLRRLSTVVLSD